MFKSQAKEAMEPQDLINEREIILERIKNGLATFSTNNEESTTPALESTTPSLESTTPSLESTTPSLESTTPSLESTTPSLESTTPALEFGTPGFEFGTPGFELGTPALELGTPALELGTPALELGTPVPESTRFIFLKFSDTDEQFSNFSADESSNNSKTTTAIISTIAGSISTISTATNTHGLPKSLSNIWKAVGIGCIILVVIGIVAKIYSIYAKAERHARKKNVIYKQLEIENEKLKNFHDTKRSITTTTIPSAPPAPSIPPPPISPSSSSPYKNVTKPSPSKAKKDNKSKSSLPLPSSLSSFFQNKINDSSNDFPKSNSMMDFKNKSTKTISTSKSWYASSLWPWASHSSNDESLNESSNQFQNTSILPPSPSPRLNEVIFYYY